MHQFHLEWQEHLPRVEPAHLTGWCIPDAPMTFAGVGVGKGAVIIELKEGHVNDGLVEHLARADGNILSSKEDREELLRLVDTKLSTERDAMKAAVQMEIEGFRAGLEGELEDYRLRIGRLEGELVDYQLRLQLLRKLRAEGYDWKALHFHEEKCTFVKQNEAKSCSYSSKEKSEDGN